MKMNRSSLCYSVKDLPDSDRPRERLCIMGPEAMSSAELIAIILGSGTREAPVLQLAQEIVARYDSMERLSEATIEELCQIKGIGMAKAVQLRAALSLGMRASRKAPALKQKVVAPSQAYNLLKDTLEKEKREFFVILLLDTKKRAIRHDIVAIGTLSRTLVHPREVFYPAIRHKAASVILAHNHPSGDPTPSQDDYEVTKSLVEAGRLMNIPVNDHLVIGDGCYVSLRQKGLEFE